MYTFKSLLFPDIEMTNKQYMQTRTITGCYIMRLEDSIFEKREAHMNE